MRFLVVGLGILGVMYGYIGLRLIPHVGLTPPWRKAAWGGLAFLVMIPLLPIFLRMGGHETAAADGLAWISYLTLGFVSLLLPILLIRDVVWLVTWGTLKAWRLSRTWLNIGAPPPPMDPGRRRFLIASMNVGLLAATGGLAGYGLYEARRRPTVVEVSVPFDNLPADLEGYRIVQISDLHVGPTIKGGYVRTIVEEVNRLAPDLIAFTGDLADGSVQRLKADAAPLGDLSAPDGSYFVTGNHEYYSGAEAWLEEVDRLGLAPLINTHQIITRGAGRMLLAGVTDYNAGQIIPGHASDPVAALTGAPPSDVKVLLAHQPRSIFAAERAGFDLQLSGHTHGGQYIPWRYVVALAHPYTAGLHKHDRAWIYVNSGTGYWGPPLRLGVPSEITVITLTRTTSPETDGV